MRILLVEDDAHTAGFIAKGLREDGHAVDNADNGRDGLFLATTETYDALHAVYRSVYAALREDMHRLAAIAGSS